MPLVYDDARRRLVRADEAVGRERGGGRDRCGGDDDELAECEPRQSSP